MTDLEAAEKRIARLLERLDEREEAMAERGKLLGKVVQLANNWADTLHKAKLPELAFELDEIAMIYLALNTVTKEKP